ncbi:MAG TPA: 6-bladed beta-propeller [Gammaproteobacteria bacterium]|nr:6-bladed beta-propeller [Gammaproteobacteria bacterium]
MTGGCANSPGEKPAHFEAPVYPPPPAKPRFVYERTLIYNDDVEAYTRAMRFKQFALGASRKLRGLVKPFDVAVHRGRIYVTDSVQRRVILFDVPGRRYLEIGAEEPGALAKPLGIDVAPNGDIYVCDITARRVMVYDGEGRFLRAIGNKTQLRRPSDVALNRDGSRAYVVDTGGVDSQEHHVVIYDTATGRKLGIIGRRGNGPGEFNLPVQLTVGRDDMLYVVDGGNFRVQAFDASGRYAFSFGTIGRMPGQFARPKGIAADGEGRLYVVDTAFGNFQIFDPQGRLLMFIGERGQSGLPGKYMLPAGIDVDEDGRIYVVDQFFRKLDIYRPVTLPSDRGYAAPRSLE